MAESAALVEKSATRSVTYDEERFRVPVMKGGSIDILATYADLFKDVGEKKFICIICSHRCKFLGKEAPVPLSMSSASNIVAHVARCAPDELTKQHAELAMYRDPATVWYQYQYIYVFIIYI